MRKKSAIGYLAFVLHAHLPYVRHPEYEEFLEEDWFYEAITETYIPLLTIYENMINDGIDFRITMSLTPPLVSMMTDELLQNRYVKRIEKLIELAEKEVERTRFIPQFNKTAHHYRDRFYHSRYVFVEKYKKNLVEGFKRIQDAGYLEIVTCTATHGFLPLMISPEAIRAQILVAAQSYRRHFGRNPKGIWLAECGYTPGVDEVLKEAGIRFFFVDSHGLLLSTPRPRYGIFAPVYCPSGVAAFGRDMESSKSVWSSEEGYPGDYRYREFYRDIGFDLDMDYIRPYIHQGMGIRKNTGIKYYRVTSKRIDLSQKQPYDRDEAIAVADAHAGNFMFNREGQIKYLYEVMGKKPPIVVSPYDAELYGHWWYEGPEWLNFVLRKIACDSPFIELTTPYEYLLENPVNQVATPSFSSWGYKGYAEFWLEGSNDWIYPHLHKAAERMVELANRFRGEPKDSMIRRILNQAARELLLAQSSDWAFIMKTGTTVEYATKRTKEHIGNFNKIYESILSNSIDLEWLAKIESKNNIFPEIDYEVYCSVQ